VSRRALRFLLVSSAAVLVMVAGLAVYRFLPVRVLTDYQGRPACSPLYAFWMPRVSVRVLVAASVALLYIAWLWFATERAPRGAWRRCVALGASWLWLLVLAIAVAGIRLPINDLGAFTRVYPGEEFWDDVPLVAEHGPTWFLANFTRLQTRNQLSLHGLQHPPGHTLFLWGVTRVFGLSAEAAALAILLGGSTGVVPLARLARRLAGEPTERRVLALYPVVPSVLLFAVAAPDFLFAGLALWSLWLAVEAVLGGGVFVALAAGAVGGMAATFSFAQAFVGLLVGIFAIARWIERPGVGRPLASMAVGLAAWYAILRWGFAFDWLDALRLAHQKYAAVVRAEFGSYSLMDWLYTSLGNLLAFAWYLGVPAVAGAALSVAAAVRTRAFGSVGPHFARSLWLTVAVMVFGGVFILEVERVWLFIVGPVLIVAAAMLPAADEPRADRRWLAALVAVPLLQAVVWETLFFTIW
jgi:hypothetical protein